MEYQYRNAKPSHTHEYLWPTLRAAIPRLDNTPISAFDLGCGNGATCNMLSRLGIKVTGVDTSVSGIQNARASFPDIAFELGNAYDDLAAKYGTFDFVYSLEVIEHCIDPRAFMRTFVSLMSPNAFGVISTPYHGYAKNLALAVSGKLDKHFTVLWDGGHIKFFSIKTLGALLHEFGAKEVRFERVGRAPFLAKSMIAVFRR
jgi:2-polyprenyl-3-methyl-5-hydroxy-6-metoxy-1,4-benzoquinol methylase